MHLIKLVRSILNFFDFFQQKKIIKFFKHSLKNDLTLFDVGSHYGETVKLFFKNFKIKDLHCFEASPLNFKILSTNIKKYNLNFNHEINNIGIGSISHDTFINHTEVDQLNVLQASIIGMQRSISAMSLIPEYIIVDGNRFKPYKDIPYKTIVKGDAKFMSIAAASVLAKTYRDDFMEKIHTEFPDYNWRKNKGYPTKEHRIAIQEFGITKYHRKTFKLLPTQLKLDI